MSEYYNSVLILEDEPDLCEFYKELLSEEGLYPEFATTVDTALKCLRSKKYDLFISDWLLPGGQKSSKILLNQKLTEFIPKSTIVITAYHMDPELETELKCNYAILAKPFDIYNLMQILESLALKNKKE